MEGQTPLKPKPSLKLLGNVFPERTHVMCSVPVQVCWRSVLPLTCTGTENTTHRANGVTLASRETAASLQLQMPDNTKARVTPDASRTASQYESLGVASVTLLTTPSPQVVQRQVRTRCVLEHTSLRHITSDHKVRRRVAQERDAQGGSVNRLVQGRTVRRILCETGFRPQTPDLNCWQR